MDANTPSIKLATRRVDEAERREVEDRQIQLKRVRGLIQDMAIELHYLGFGSRVTTPEVVTLQDKLLTVYSDFVEAQSSASARDYVSPAEHTDRVEYASPSLRAEMEDGS